MKDSSEGYNKRLRNLIIAIVGIIAVTTAGLFYLVKDKPESDEIDSTVEITEVEKLESVDTAESFMNAVGNFGVITDKLTGDNALDVSYILSEKGNDSSNYTVSRSDSYLTAKTDYVYAGSPLDYDSRDIISWHNTFETEKMMTTSISNVITEVSENGFYLKVGDSDVKAVNVKVTFDSKEIVRDVTANDVTWDGSYSVMEKKYVNTTADLTLAKTSDDEWKVYSIRNLDKPYLLSSWKNPVDEGLVERETGFNEIGKLERTVPFKEPNE